MTVTITIDAPDAESVRAQMRQLLAITLQTGISAPAVSDVSSDSGPIGTGGVTNDVETVATSKPARRSRPTKTGPQTLEATPTSVTVEPQQAISTGEEREPVAEEAQPEAVDLTPYAEPEAKTYTMEDVRNAATPYIKKHTMAFAQLDLQDCLEAAVGIRQISKLNPADQAQLKKAIDAFDAAGKAEARFVKAA